MVHGMYVREMTLRENNVFYKKQTENRFIRYDQSLLKWVITGLSESSSKIILCHLYLRS